MTGEPVPTWVRVIAIVVATATALVVVPAVVLSAVALASPVAQIQQTTTFEVGSSPRLRVDAKFGTVVIEAARDGQIVVEDRRSASGITRAAAAAALRRLAVDVTRQGDLVLVRQAGTPVSAPEVDSSSTITVEVPARTDMDVGNVGDLRIRGVDGTVHVQSSGTVALSDVTLRGASTVDASVGRIHLTNATVAGSATVTMGIGEITFGGQLVPGTALDLEDRAGSVSVVLPPATDARAVITSDLGDFHPDTTWLFTPDSVAAPRRWTADLTPNPTSTVTVNARVGAVTFGSR